MCLFPSTPKIPDPIPPIPPPPEVKPMEFKEKTNPTTAKRLGTKRLQVPPRVGRSSGSGVAVK